MEYINIFILLLPVVLITIKNCPYYRGHLLVLLYKGGMTDLLYRVAGCPYVSGCNSIEFNDTCRSVGTVTTAVCYIVDVHNSGVFVKGGFTVLSIVICVHVGIYMCNAMYMYM